MNATPPCALPRRLPLIPLAEEVHFPRTELRLLVVEKESRRLVTEVHRQGPGWIGTVLLRTGSERGPATAVYGSGTAARLIALDSTDEGCHIVLAGQHRFQLEGLIADGPWHEGWIQPMDEPTIFEGDPSIQRARRDTLRLVNELSGELGRRFALNGEGMSRLTEDLSFEALINHLAANLDLAPRKKLRLLRLPLPRRARALLGILRGRRAVLDLLRPFRHLAHDAALQ